MATGNGVQLFLELLHDSLAAATAASSESVARAAMDEALRAATILAHYANSNGALHARRATSDNAHQTL